MYTASRRHYTFVVALHFMVSIDSIVLTRKNLKHFFFLATLGIKELSIISSEGLLRKQGDQMRW
jgi:hypothetical protein